MISTIQPSAVLGLAGLLAFVLWSLVLLRGLWRREGWVAAAFAAVLFLGLQTDVIGVHWLAYVLWALAGAAATPTRGAPLAAVAGPPGQRPPPSNGLSPRPGTSP